MTVATSTTHPAVGAQRRVEQLVDLTQIRFKLENPETGAPPTTATLDTMETEYRKFLALRLAYPDTDIVPCELVDEMWHRHILDTRAYAADCQALFGHFLHHFPYFGMRGEADAEALEAAYEDTLARYRDAFGEPPADTWVSRDASGRCRTACKPMRCR